MICAICRREARGFGWIDPSYKRSNPKRWDTYRQFCSMRCLALYARRMKTGEGMIDPTPHEKAAMQAVLMPLGEIVGEIGMQKPLADYSKEQVLTLIEVVVTAYQDHLLSAYQDFPEA